MFVIILTSTIIITDPDMEEEHTTSTCLLCYEEESIFVLPPCNHRHICWKCTLKLVNGSILSCPFCKVSTSTYSGYSRVQVQDTLRQQRLNAHLHLPGHHGIKALLLKSTPASIISEKHFLFLLQRKSSQLHRRTDFLPLRALRIGARDHDFLEKTHLRSASRAILVLHRSIEATSVWRTGSASCPNRFYTTTPLSPSIKK